MPHCHDHGAGGRRTCALPIRLTTLIMIQSPPSAKWHNFGLFLHSRGLSGACTSYDCECLPVRHTTTNASQAGCVPSQYHGCLKPPHYYASTVSGPSEVGLLSSFRLMLSSQVPRPSEGLFEPLLHVSLSGLRASGGTQALVPSVLWLMLSGALLTVTVHRTVPSHDLRSPDLAVAGP